MLIGPKANIEDLRSGVEAAARAYVKERRRMRRRKPGVMEHRRLSALSEKLEAISAELVRVQASPNCSGKLAESLEEQAKSAGPSAAKLASMIDGAFGPGDPVAHIAELLNLLHKSASQTVYLNEEETPDSYHNADLDHWHRRPKKTESQPVFALARAFRPYWDRNAMRPYNAGRYDKATKQNKAIAVDVIHLIACKLDPELPRARVVTVMREI
ncbi:hypothetical protein PH5382_03901 [Phaeobacter sp. CECT 5382]|nr:hypothetical protein PH5382_03901 [Phaeobacter sp. CECT 5382]